LTHQYDFAESFHRQDKGYVLFLRAEREPDGRRTYKLAEPLPTSFGEDLYRRIGGWLEEDRASPAGPASPSGPEG
jgi:hypothetical protein